MLDLLKDKRQKVLEETQERLNQIIENLKKAGIENLQKPVDFEEPDMDEPLKVVVFGEYNAGKSSLINALLGMNVARTGSVPTTDRIVEYVFSEKEETVLLGNRVQAGLRNERLRRYVLVDLPGTNSAIEEHERTVREYINRSDLVLFCSSAVQPLKNSELWLIREFIKDGHKMLFLLTQADLLEKEELEKVRVYVETRLHEIFARRVPVLAVSAKRYRESGSDEGMSELLEYIEGQAKELKGKRLREYRYERWLNTLLNQIKLYEKVLSEKLSTAEEEKEKCHRIAHYLEEKWQSVESWIKTGRENLLRYAEELQIPKVQFLSRFLKFFKSSSQDHVKEEYRRFLKNLSMSVEGYFEEVRSLLSVQIPEVSLPANVEAFVKGFSKTFTLRYIALFILSIMLMGSAVAFVMEVFSFFSKVAMGDIATALSGVLFQTGFLILLAVFFYKAAKGWFTEVYVKHHLENLKNYLINRKDEVMNQIRTECRKREERERLLRSALEEMHDIKKKLEGTYEIS